MVLPMQVQAPKLDAGLIAKSSTNSGMFGSVLASMTANESVSGELNVETSELSGIMAELLETTSVEEVLQFLQENGLTDLGFIEVMDGHFIVQDDEFMDLLATVFPELTTQQMLGEENLYAIDVKDLLAQMETLAPELLSYMQEDSKLNMMETLSNDDLLKVLAMMQMAAIEGPKTDLTLKQEQQLHSLQEILKSLGAFLNDKAQATVETKPALPFMEVKIPAHLTESTTGASQQFKEQFTETANQAAHHMTAAGKIEGTQLVNENQNNSRAEQLMKELQNIFKRANLGQAGGTNRISIKLYPEHLGQLRIELLQTNGILTARILASNVLGKEMLESQLHQLRQAFLQQNIQVERIDISQMLTETPYREREHSFGQQFKGEQQNDEQNHQEQEEESMTFSEYMIELEG